VFFRFLEITPGQCPGWRAAPATAALRHVVAQSDQESRRGRKKWMHWSDRNVAVATQRVRQANASPASVAAEPKRVRTVKLAAAPRPAVERPLLVRNGVLTSQESEVSDLLARASNKAIARILVSVRDRQRR
jgi:hypothetical protein